LVACNIAPEPGDEAALTLDGALDAARYLTETLEVPVLLGPSSSSDVGAVFQQVRERGTFLISPSATSPALTGRANSNLPISPPAEIIQSHARVSSL
jgi:ABC-type branched-subunit amino acid transport system substrate-binding protein